MSHTFTPHPIYHWLTIGCLVLTGLLGWSLVQSILACISSVSTGEPWCASIPAEESFFFVISAGAGLWFANAGFSRVKIKERAIVLQRPLRGGYRVEFRQLVSVTASGRFTQSLSLLYYPRQPDNLLDLDHVRHLSLPAVTDQERLLTAIEACIPK